MERTGPREDREGNFPLSPFHYVMFPKHLISRARATRFNAERYNPNHSPPFPFVLGGRINRRIPNDSIFSSRPLLPLLLPLSRPSRLRITVSRFGGCARGARRRLAGVKNSSQCCPEKYCVDRLAPIMEDKRDPAESAIKPRRMRGPDFYCAVYGRGSAIFETYAK